jgi:3',5'-cyclic AMP phosphodiesterase CpdA
MRLVQLSDIHFGGACEPAAAAAAAFTRDFAPDLTVVTGDVTLNGLPREFEAAAAWLDTLPEPRLCTPGNHDTPYWNLLLRAFTPFRRYRRWIGEPWGGAFDGADFRVRMINTSRGGQPRPDWSKGAINLDRCRRAATELAEGPARALRVVGCHHPLIDMPGAPVSGGVHRGALAAEILAGGGVDLILTGHVHVPFAAPLGPDGRTYAVGAGTLSVRLRGAPPGFNVIEADADGIRVTAQGWTGSDFTPWRTWELPRRPAA